MTTNRRGGVYSVRISGQLVELAGPARFIPGVEAREVLNGPAGPYGYKAEGRAARLELKIAARSDLNLTALLAMDGETVTTDLPNGETVTMAQAWRDGEPELSTEDGAWDVAFAAKYWAIDS